MWKKNLPFLTMHTAAFVTGPFFDIGNFIPLWVWTGLFGGLVVATVWAYSNDAKSVWHRFTRSWTSDSKTPQEPPKRIDVYHHQVPRETVGDTLFRAMRELHKASKKDSDDSR